MTVSVWPAFGSAIAILANGLIVASSLTACPATAPVIVGGDVLLDYVIRNCERSIGQNFRKARAVEINRMEDESLGVQSQGHAVGRNRSKLYPTACGDDLPGYVLDCCCMKPPFGDVIVLMLPDRLSV